MKLLLYVADEFKTLEGGKTLAVGLFTDRVVVLNVPKDVPEPTTELPYGIPLGLLACVVGSPIEEVHGTAAITPPSGQPAMPAAKISGRAPGAGAMNFLFRFDPFLMTGAGVYTLTVALEGFEPLSETFELRVQRTDSNSDQGPILMQRLTAPPTPP